MRSSASVNPVRDSASCAVTAIADDQRGERLVVLYAQCGLSPADLWQRLSETDLPLYLIAERTGFEHVEYLSVVFKREEGRTPSEFREGARG